MEVKNAFFCDYANLEVSGKVNVLGIFNDINSVQFPVTQSQFFFVALIEGHRSESGQHQIKINFVDEDGKDVLPSMNAPFEITSNKPDSTFILNLQGVVFSKPGAYSADIVVDNHHLRSVKLVLNKIQP